jgi:plastocyanin
MTMRTLGLAAALLALAAALGASESSPLPMAAAPTAGDDVAPAAGKAAVTGRVVFDGPIPAPALLTATPEQQKGCCPDGGAVPLTDPSLLVDAQGGIANVVVTIEVEGTEAEPSRAPLVIDQKRCTFEPHVGVLHAGSKVQFLNSDSVTHNVRASSLKNDSFNWVMTPGGKEEVAFERPDRVVIGCDYHPWMSMIVVVTDTPYHAVSGADGTYAIRGLKPGTYKAKFWHEKLGRKEIEVVVPDSGVAAPVEVKMAPKKKKV